MFSHDTADAERFEQVIVQSVRQILAVPEPERFLSWAREQIPGILGLEELGLDEPEAYRLANLLARAVWNATPQPERGFRILPLDDPDPDAPCHCGSGEAFGECCGAIGEPPVLSSDVIWELLIAELPSRLLSDALSVDAIPPHLLAAVAERWLAEENRPGRAVALLEPLFADSLEDLGAEMDSAMDCLCGAYDRLGHWRKKHAFLARLAADGSRDLRACAWQRISTIRVDDGDFPGAEAAFGEALRCDPDNPGTALLEITLLAAQHKDEIARRRAQFWLHKLRRLGLDDESLLDFFARASEDPQEALVDSHTDALDPVLVDLHDWVELVASRPIPTYQVIGAKPPAPRTPDGQLRLFADADLARIKGRSDESAIPAQLRAPQRIRRIETLWRAMFPWRKPVSTQLVLVDGDALWLKSEWTDYLLGHPEAADSIEILDDLANALYVHPESALPWIAHALLRPLVERAWCIVLGALPDTDPRRLPWIEEHNRPILRLMFRRYLFQVEAGEDRAAVETLETLLRLNPADNHGVRGELMNHYLRAGEDGDALELARKFPDDTLVDLAYGEVLALYRLGEQERARAALRLAAERLPRIPHYLTRKRVKRPPLTSLAELSGLDPRIGEGQAWHYRQAMRDVWEAEPGLLSWLKRVIA